MTADDLLTSFPELERVPVSELEIQQRVAELGRMLDVEYQDSHPLLIGVLTGAFIFVADLVRAMTIPLDVEFIGVSSYGLATATSGVVKFVKDLDRPVEGRDVIVVE